MGSRFDPVQHATEELIAMLKHLLVTLCYIYVIIILSLIHI